MRLVIDRRSHPLDPDFTALVHSASGQALSLCYQCRKCTAGCPMAHAMDFWPHKLIRLVQLGAQGPALRAHGPWLCAGCGTCSARCPNGLDVSRVMDAVKELAEARGLSRGGRARLFHRIFLDGIRLFGRQHEATLLARYKLSSGSLLGDLVHGLRLAMKGKVPLLPTLLRGRRSVAAIFARTQGGGEG